MATTAQKAKFVTDFYATTAAMGPVLGLRSKYDISEVEAAYKALRDAITPWSNGALPDKEIAGLLLTLAGTIGAVTLPDGTPVMDTQTPDGVLLRKLSESIPELRVKFTGEVGEIGITGKVPTSVMVIGVLAIAGVLLYYGAKTNKDTAETEEKMRRMKPMTKAQFQNWLEA